MNSLIVYGDLMSQPVRAVLVFCKINNIKFDFSLINIAKKQHLTEEYKKINPSSLVPAIKFSNQVKSEFCLGESHAILRFLSGMYEVDEKWYPRKDLFRKAKIDQYLDFHHLGVRFILTNKFRESTEQITKKFGLVRKGYHIDDKLVEDLFSKFDKTLSTQKYIVDNEISIADLSFTCEVNQFYLLKYNFDSFPNLERYLKEMNSIPEMINVNKTIIAFSIKTFNFAGLTKL